MTNILTEKEKQKLFESREVKDEILNRVLNKSLELVKSSALGMKVLKGANYKDVISEQSYNDAKSKHIFAVDKAYVGIAGKVKGGHCGLISAIDGDKTYENARGEVYINSEFIRGTIDKLGEEKASIYLTNILTHEFMHGKQRTHSESTPEDSRSRPKDEAFRKNSMTYEESVLAEAGAMSAGITVLCSMQLDEEIKNHAFEDLQRMGNLNSDKLDILKNIINANPKSISDSQENARIMLNIFLEGQQRNYAEHDNILVDFNKCPEMIKAVYQKDIFGDVKDFVESIPGLNDENKRSISLLLNPNNMTNHLRKLRGLSDNEQRPSETELTREYNNKTVQKEEGISHLSNHNNQKYAAKEVEKKGRTPTKEELARFKMVVNAGKGM